MSEPEATGGLPEESSSLPPDYDAPGQVDYPDPAFEDEATEEADFESPDDAEPEPDDDEDDEDEDESEV